jgi:hypothetical protein
MTSIVDPFLPRSAADVQDAKNGIEAGTITAFYMHIAEGTDAASREELSALANLNLLTSSSRRSLREQTVRARRSAVVGCAF